MSKPVYVLQKHTTFTQKNKIAFVVVHRKDNDKSNTYSIMYGKTVYGTTNNVNYLKNRPNGQHLLFIPFLINDEITIPPSGTKVSTIEDLQKYLPIANGVSTFNQLLQKAYLSKATLLKKQLNNINDKHAYLGFRNEAGIHLRTHFDIRVQVGKVLKSFVSNSEKLPNEYKKKMFVVESQDHPMTWKDFEGVLPYGYGMGYTKIIDKTTVNFIDKKEKFLKFTIDGEYLKGTYALVRLNAKSKVWVFTRTTNMLPTEDKNLFKVTMPRIARPSYLKVNYKYNATMAPVTRPITYLQDVIDDKHFNVLYEGKEELLISPVYSYKGTIGCMLMLDFDGSGSVSGVNKFLEDMEKFGLVSNFFVVKSGGGYHVGSFFGINDYKIEDLKKFKVWKRYKGLDITSSFRDVPIRVPFTYNFKRKATNIAVRAKDFHSLTSKLDAVIKNPPSAIMTKQAFKKNINYFLYAHDFLQIKLSLVRKFFKFLEEFK